MITSDLHLGHKGITKYRKQFAYAEEHHGTMFENLATNVGKRDTLFMLGDMAFTMEWHLRLAEIKCRHKVLILGNHETDRGVKVKDFAPLYDKIHSMLSHRNYWFTHCPIHPQEFRGRLGNIHGHLHGNNVWMEEEPEIHLGPTFMSPVDQRYLNACVEHTNWKPISFEEITSGTTR